MADQRPTHRSIAKRAGVSPGTVSLALRNDPRISDETKDRIRKISEEMGYKPNPNLSMLMSHIRANKKASFECSLAYVHTVPKSSGIRKNHPTPRRNLEGAKERADSLGYTLREFELHEPGMTAKRLCEIIYSQGIKGIIVEFHPIPELNQFRLDFDWSLFASVTLGVKHPDPVLHHVSPNYFKVAAEAYKNARAMGYDRIGVALSDYTDSSYEYQLIGGYYSEHHKFISNNDIPPIEIKEKGYKDFVEWFHKYKPSVVIGNDRFHHTYIRECGYKIPKDIGWIYLDCSEDWPNATGMNLYHELSGAAAVDIVSAQINRNEYGVPRHPKIQYTGVFWTRGRSVYDKINSINNEGLVDELHEINF